MSPKFQKNISEKFSAKNILFSKKYAPNLKTITSEEEFASKIEFPYEYNGKNIATVVLYSQKKSNWSNSNYLEKINNILHNILKARYISKFNTQKKNTNQGLKYLDKVSYKILNTVEQKTEISAYTAIIEIANYAELEENLQEEELDTFKLKISEKIMNYLDKDEQVFKSNKDEYTLVLFAKNEKEALNKLNCIANIIDKISYNSYNAEIIIGASSCIIDGSFNIFEAQKTARKALDSTSKLEKVAIKNGK